ncbi:MAG: AAA family ATPase [Clostridia bacterium]|nr:AAA family ATPase [Clostridia bacterium]
MASEIILKRKIDADLEEWYCDPEKKPLIIMGCRQCGKTTSVMLFCEKHYKNIVYIDFFHHPEYIPSFNGSLDVDDIILNLSSRPNTGFNFVPHQTVIVFDEIQSCPNAITSLKFFKIDGRYDVISTGSLLGVEGYGEKPVSYPVGFVHNYKMYPLDFEEFLWANRISDKVIARLKECMDSVTPVPEGIHLNMMDLVKKYIVVGGMPEAVKEFLKSKQYNKVLNIQRDILIEYRKDMTKYAIGRNIELIKDCFVSIPKQLAKENKKFQISLLPQKASGVQVSSAIHWLEDAGIVVRCCNLDLLELPLDGNSIHNIYKVYPADIGLFISMLEDGTQDDIISGDMATYKGYIYEGYVADVFSKMNRKCYYFKKNSGLELDFVMRYKGKLTPVETKSTTGNTKSLKTVLTNHKTYNVEQAIKLGAYNIGNSAEDGKILTLPLYMAFLLRES